MNIGELAKRTGLNPSPIRLYEQSGLLRAAQRGANNYRTYPPEMVQVLELITLAQDAGFSLEEIRALLPAGLEHWEHDTLTTLLRRKISDIAMQEQKLAHDRSQLTQLLQEIEAKPADMDCAANARRVLVKILARNKEN